MSFDPRRPQCFAKLRSRGSRCTRPLTFCFIDYIRPKYSMISFIHLEGRAPEAYRPFMNEHVAQQRVRLLALGATYFPRGSGRGKTPIINKTHKMYTVFGSDEPAGSRVLQLGRAQRSAQGGRAPCTALLIAFIIGLHSRVMLVLDVCMLSRYRGQSPGHCANQSGEVPSYALHRVLARYGPPIASSATVPGCC